MSEDQSANGPGGETDRIDQERLERSDKRIGVWKEFLREYQASDRAI